MVTTDKFTKWLEHPYTKALMDSVEDDYVPADTAIMWVNIDEALPAIIETPNKYGMTSFNSVLARYKDGIMPDYMCEFQVVVTKYMHNYPHQFTHWAYIVDPRL